MISIEGDNSEFRELVECVSKDTNPATMLFELERIGAVEHTKNGIRRLTGESYYRGAPEKAINLIFRNVETLVESGEENLEATHKLRNLFLRTEYDNVRKDAVP